MNEFFKMLVVFTNGNTPCRKYLVEKFSAELVDEAIREEYIIEIRKNDLGDPVYDITQKGKDKRDK